MEEDNTEKTLGVFLLAGLITAVTVIIVGLMLSMSGTY